jgi:hypothetical protein
LTMDIDQQAYQGKLKQRVWKKPLSKTMFWQNFDLDEFFKDAEKVGEIIRRKEEND